MEIRPELKRVVATSRGEWRNWLSQHHLSAQAVMLVYFKLDSGVPSVTYPEAVREALAFGWIDTTRYALDAQRYQQVFTPRRSGSPWSRLNKSYAEELDAAGLMTPAGLAAIEAARLDGSWDASEAGESLSVPADLQAALDANPAAALHFDAFPASIRKYILQWIAGAKRPETRASRVGATVEQAAQNVRIRGGRPPG
jgi:uncharacterized protein YdeI (YjbR/CyaY-like superfamily)